MCIDSSPFFLILSKITTHKKLFIPLFLLNLKARSSMDRMTGFGPVDGGSNPSEPVLKMKEKVICVFGASTTWGAWDLDKAGWVNRLRLYIDKGNLEDKHYICVYNLGVDGNTSGDILKRVESECKSRNPDLIIFSLGGNDSVCDLNKNPRVPIEKFEKNVLELISISKKFSKNIFFVGLYGFDESKTMPVEWDKSLFCINEIVEKYDEALRKVTKTENVFYVDVSNLFDKTDFEDGIHLDSGGHEKLFNEVKNFLEDKKLK